MAADIDTKAVQDGCWKDITDEFKSSVCQLNLGELSKTDQFTLLEAMSAIELMDPKMDSGMILKKSNREILTLEQSIKAGRIKTNHLDLNELIGIIDDSYACLVTWLEGHPLAQTVMTNLYLHDTKRIEDRCLRVFCQAILKITDFLDRLVHTVFCIEEEDFVPNYGKFNLTVEVNDQKILNYLEDLCQYYEKFTAVEYLKEITNRANNNCSSSMKHSQETTTQRPEASSFEHKSRAEDQENNLISSTTASTSGTCSEDSNCPTSAASSSNSNDKIQTQLTALIDRLRFTQNFFAFLLNLVRNFLKPRDIQTAAQIQKTIKLFQTSLVSCDQSLNKSLISVDKWKRTIDLGIEPQSMQKGGNDQEFVQSDGDYPTIMGFEPLINHKVLAPAYPRCPNLKSRSSTVNYLKELVLKLRECIRISNVFYQKSFNKSVDAIEEFSNYCSLNSCVISRSFLQTIYLPNRTIAMMKDELLQSLSDYCEPLVQIMKKEENNHLLDTFLEGSSKTFCQAVALYGLNKARQHEKYPDLIVEFKNLQCSAYLLNDVFKNGLIYSWTTYNLAKLCTKYVLAGLELELFAAHEYPYVFWYLYDILYRNEKEQLELAKQLLIDSHFAITENGISGSGATGAGGNAGSQSKKLAAKMKRPRKRSVYNTSFHDETLLVNDAYRFLTGGMFLLTYGLKLQGKIQSPSMEYTSEEVCFDHRFGNITGASVYQSYKTTLSRLEKLEYIYREAFECFSEAKAMLERHGNQEQCLNVCKTNMVVTKILASNPKTFAERQVEFCFDKHPNFPTVKCF